MPKFISIISILFFFCFSCESNSLNTETAQEVVQETESQDTLEVVNSALWKNSDYSDDSMHMDLSITQKEGDIDLILDIKLFGNSWIVSPQAENYPYGKMDIKLEKNIFCELETGVIENPQSKVVQDFEFEEGYQIIKDDTRLSQGINLKTKEDFKVQGTIFLVLEPVCELNEIHFLIVSNSGKISVHKAKDSNPALNITNSDPADISLLPLLLLLSVIPSCLHSQKHPTQHDGNQSNVAKKWTFPIESFQDNILSMV
jgi:hypothetical protein